MELESSYKKEIESNPHFYRDQEKDHNIKNSKYYFPCLPTQQILLSMSADSQENTKETHDNCINTFADTNLPDDDLSISQIIDLHRQVSQDIEYTLRTSDTNFWLCYYKYLTLYRRIISKCRGTNTRCFTCYCLCTVWKRRGVEIICQSCIAAPELKYNQQLFPEGNLA